MGDTVVIPSFNKSLASLTPSSKMQEQGEKALYAARKSETKLIKDLIEISNDVSSSKLEAKKGQKVPLSPPTNAKKTSSSLGDEYTPSIIAIIGKVLALQAKTNSNFWSTLWKEASLGMKFAVNFAPLIAKAVKSSYNYQASQSKQESNMAMWNSIISFAMFGMAVGWGGFEQYQEESAATDPEGKNETLPNDQDPEIAQVNELEENDDNSATDSEDDEDEEIIDASANSRAKEQNMIRLEDAESDAVGDQIEATKRVNDENPPGSKIWKKMKGLKDGMSGKMKSVGGALGKTAEKAFTVNMMMQVGTQANEAAHKSNIAGIQEKTGAQEAASKEMEQFAQYWNQLFSRAEDLRQGSQQFIDYAMNILKSVSDSVTQTVQSMFRG